MPPGLPGVPVPGSLKGEPGLFAALPGVVSPRSKKALIRATNTDLRMTLLLLSGGAPAAWRPWGVGDTSVIPVAQQWSTAIQAHKSHREHPSAYALGHTA